jgi:glycosyltransferase involved in cell wall biosynthesis
VRVATVFAGVPNPWQAGGPLTHWATIGALLDAGHEVTFVSLPWDEPRSEQRVAALKDRGVEVVTVPARADEPHRAGRWRARFEYARTLAWPPDETLFPSLAYARPLARVLSDVRPEVVLAHGTPAVTAAARLPYPKLALMSDPPGLSRRLRTRYEPTHPWGLGRDELLYRVGTASYAFRADRRAVELLRGYDSVGEFAAHHAAWMAQRGVRAWYAQSPITDAAGPEWRERRRAAGPNPRPRLLMIGHLRGVSTISGLHVLVRDVLPRLDEALGREGFDLHLVGAHEPPASLRSALQHPAVHLRGHVEPPDGEFLRADVVLVPTPVETGPRVRILTALSFGCCVVAHSANQLGIPALEHGRNVLLAPSEHLAEQTLLALGEPALRERLGAAGRQLYESRFTPEKAGARIVGALEGLARTADARARQLLPA